MSWYHWFVVVIPVSFVIAMAVYSHRYAKSVADYLVAGRVAGRYVLSAAGLMDGLAVISLIASVEANYKTGFAMGFWYNLLLPLGLFMGLFGYVSYRFRQTRAMSGGQYLEMRYNRAFRVFATIMRVFGEMLANCIGPAVAARFFIYLLGIPHRTTLFGWTIPTFPLLLVVCISLAMVVILSGGRIALIVADSIQGIISYPIFLILVVFVATEFSWSGQIAAVAADRIQGESFLNPYDVQGLRDFNMFALVLTVFNQFFGWRAWIGNDHSGVGRTPHEQKMAGILGNWRGGFAYMMITLLVLSVITVMNHKDFAGTADTIRHELSARVVDEIARGDDAGPAVEAPAVKPLWKRPFESLVDITPEYTLGDKILAWSVFVYSVVYQFFLAFLCVVMWHLCANAGFCSPWSVEGWSNYFYVTNIAIPSISGVITTVWFMWGGIKDIRALFQALETRKRDALDNGMVEGHVSLADKAAFSAAMSGKKPDADSRI